MSTPLQPFPMKVDDSVEAQCFLEDAGECDQSHHREDGGVHRRGVDVLNSDESRKDEEQDRCGEEVYRPESAPEEAENYA